MKKSKLLLFMAIGAVALTGCQKDEIQSSTATKGDLAKVNFEINATLGEKMQGKMRAMRPEYSHQGFSIYAYRQIPGTTDFVYEDIINLTNYSNETHKATGTKNLPIGTYKFVPTYGVTNKNYLTLPPFSGSYLTDNITFDYNQSSPIDTEIFLKTDYKSADLTTYDIGLVQGSDQTVSATLKRAVGRVDIMFISATKSGDNYTEKAYVVNGSDNNIFGGRVVESLKLNFTNTNTSMNLFGDNRTAIKTNSSVVLTDLTERITLGNGSNTAINSTYTRFDNVQENDIISGAAHVFGTYLFPNNDGQKNVSLEILIKLTGLPERSIMVTMPDRAELNYLPIERNKVTVVKIYVLNDNNVGTSTAEFEYELDLVWEDGTEVSGEIS